MQLHSLPRHADDCLSIGKVVFSMLLHSHAPSRQCDIENSVCSQHDVFAVFASLDSTTSSDVKPPPELLDVCNKYTVPLIICNL